MCGVELLAEGDKGLFDYSTLNNTRWLLKTLTASLCNGWMIYCFMYLTPDKHDITNIKITNLKKYKQLIYFSFFCIILRHGKNHWKDSFIFLVQFFSYRLHE